MSKKKKGFHMSEFGFLVPDDPTGMSTPEEEPAPSPLNGRTPTRPAAEVLGHQPGPRDVGWLLAHGYLGDEGWFDSSEEKMEKRRKAFNEQHKSLCGDGFV